MKNICVTILVVLSFIQVCCAADSKTTASGSGRTRNEAIRSALNTAVEQKYGMNLASISKNQLSSSESFSSVDNQETSNRLSSDRLSQDIKTITRGRITGYTIISMNKNPDSGEYTAVLEVAFPAKYVVGDDPDALRRMAVVPFRINMSQFSVFGTNISGEAWEYALSNALNVYMTQSRKFSMLDRTFDDEINKELARLNDSNAAPRDAVRLCQKLATDYLVVGTVSFTNVQAPGKNPYTGKVIMPTQTVFATVNYRVLLAATGQLKWSDSIQIDAGYFYNSLVGGSLQDSANYAANLIGGSIISCILPYEIAGFSPDGTIVIGEGGKTFEVGELLSVYNLGKEVIDTRTGKVIDNMEIRAGMVQIVRKTEKLSYAVVVSGSREQMKVGARLRRDEYTRQAAAQSGQAAPPAPQGGVVKSTPQGGVVVPF